MPGSSVHAEAVAGGSKRPLENYGLGMEHAEATFLRAPCSLKASQKSYSTS